MQNDSLNLEDPSHSPLDFEEITLGLTQVTKNGEKKHGKNTWLDPDNKSINSKANFESIFRHVANACAGIKKDKDSSRQVG